MAKWKPDYSALLVSGPFMITIFYFNAFPGNYGIGIIAKHKPIILYFDYLEQPFVPSHFPSIVSFASAHGFNTMQSVNEARISVPLGRRVSMSQI